MFCSIVLQKVNPSTQKSGEAKDTQIEIIQTCIESISTTLVKLIMMLQYVVKQFL